MQSLLESAPSYVVFDASTDTTGCCDLVDGRAYKVFDVTNNGNWYTIFDEAHIMRHYDKKYFINIFNN